MLVEKNRRKNHEFAKVSVDKKYKIKRPTIFGTNLQKVIKPFKRL